VQAGIRTAILGSLWVIAITILFAFPVGVGAAIYLEEYASDTPLNRLIQTNINNLAGVPSIIYGMLGLAIFVRVLEPLTSGAAFGVVEDATTANGRTILSAGLTLGLLILPLIIINAQEAIRAVPNSLRQASYGVGATKWQTIWNHVLPNALPGILTGAILAISRAIGETAPLVVVGASTYITYDPDGPFSKFTVLPIQIYQWTSRPQDVFRNIAAAAIIVLLVLLFTMNATAVLLRNRYSKKL
jgi:phosphate transport system permease protein